VTLPRYADRVDEPKVEDAEVRGLQVLQVALGLGPVFFWVVIGVLAQAPAATNATPAGSDPLQLIVLLSAVHAFMAPTQWFLGTMLHGRALKANPTFAGLRQATIVRLALFEAPALLGGVVCLLAVQMRVAGAAPWVWVNAASTLLLVGLVVGTFPSRERVERTLRDAARERV
jgi:hypothetical protein